MRAQYRPHVRLANSKSNTFPPSPPRPPRVVRAAAQALCSLTLKNQANKTRCASLDAVATLLDLAAVWGVAEDGERTSEKASTIAIFRRLYTIA